MASVSSSSDYSNFKKFINKEKCSEFFKSKEIRKTTNIEILMCFFHVIKNVKEYLKSIDEKSKQKFSHLKF